MNQDQSNAEVSIRRFESLLKYQEILSSQALDYKQLKRIDYDAFVVQQTFHYKSYFLTTIEKVHLLFFYQYSYLKLLTFLLGMK